MSPRKTLMAAGRVAIGGSILIAAAGCAAPAPRQSGGDAATLVQETAGLKAAAEVLTARAAEVVASAEQIEASLVRVDASVEASAEVLTAKVGEINNTIGGGDNNNVTTWLSLGLWGLISIIQVVKPIWRWNRTRTIRRVQQGGSL